MEGKTRKKRKVILEDLKKERGHCKLKEVVLDRVVWGTCFRKGCGHVILTYFIEQSPS
jgi:hypothetical protein